MLCRLTCNSALRKIGVLAAGREARASDLNDTFDHLKGLYRQLINNGAFGVLCDVIPTADYTACGNERIFRNTEDVVSITLPETIRNDAFYCDWCIYGRYPCEPVPTNATTLDVRTPRDCSVVSIINGLDGSVMDFIYDGQQKQWQGIYDLGLDDEAPLSFRDPQGLSALLAIRIADEYGRELGPITAMMAANFMEGITVRPSFRQEAYQGVYM